MILITDSGPNDDWVEAAKKMRSLGERGKIQYIGIGDEADHETMCRILLAQPGAPKLRGLRFKPFFRCLTDLLKSVSASAVSDGFAVLSDYHVLEVHFLRNSADCSRMAHLEIPRSDPEGSCRIVPLDCLRDPFPPAVEREERDSASFR